jgi:hypothetical protein
LGVRQSVNETFAGRMPPLFFLPALVLPIADEPVILWQRSTERRRLVVDQASPSW